MVFFSTCACVEYFGVALGRLLRGLVDVTAIHGKKAKRDRVFDSFRKKAESGEGASIKYVCTEGGRGSKNQPILRTNSTGNADEGVGRGLKYRKSCGRT